MNELQIFNYNSSEVRVTQLDGEPWFVLKDVCQVRGISNHKMTAQRLDKDEVRHLFCGVCGAENADCWNREP